MPQQVSVTSTLTILSIVCWALSLLLPAANLGIVTANGWEILVSAWRAIGSLDIVGLSWLANPLLLGAWLTFFAFPGHRHLLAGLASGALFAALTSFLYNAVTNESEGMLVESFEPGFYVWLASTLLQTVAAIVRLQEPATSLPRVTTRDGKDGVTA